MSAFFNKFFTGASSSSNVDLGSMESLCAAINNLSTEKHEIIGERAAEIVRQNRDLFEKKTTDVEAFLLHCSPLVGSAAMVAAIKGMFDASSSKNNEAGQERAVELLNHYVDENNFVGEHLKLVPEITFPLLRSVGTYCLEKKNKPDIGQRIISKAFGSMFPRTGNGVKVLTSAHSVLFSCALKSKDYAVAEPFIDIHIDEIANEKCVQEGATEDQSLAFGNLSRLKVLQKGQLTSLMGNAPSIPFMSPKFVLDYLYNGACILIELKRFEDALFLLETLVAIPAFTIQDQQADGYKKFVLISLLLNGKVVENTDKMSATRNLKAKTPEYKALSEVKFSRSANTHTKVDELVQNSRDKLRRDGNLDLAKLVVLEMKKKTMISLTKLFTSISLTEIQALAFLKNRTQVNEVMDQLVAENRINMTVEGDMVFWSEIIPIPTKEIIEAKIITVDHLNHLLQERNKDMKSGSGRLRPSVMYNEDEGLSMPPIE